MREPLINDPFPCSQVTFTCCEFSRTLLYSQHPFSRALPLCLAEKWSVASHHSKAKKRLGVESLRSKGKILIMYRPTVPHGYIYSNGSRSEEKNQRLREGQSGGEKQFWELLVISQLDEIYLFLWRKTCCENIEKVRSLGFGIRFRISFYAEPELRGFYFPINFLQS